MTSNPNSLLALPQELTEHALVLSHPRDVANFAQTCRSARALVYGQHDQHLWRRLFLEQPFDDPRHPLNNFIPSTDHDPNSSFDWRILLQRRIYAIRILQKIERHPGELADALGELVDVVRHAPPMSEQPDESKDLIWVLNLLRELNFFRNVLAPAQTIDDMDTDQYGENSFERQRVAELWCALGWRDSLLNNGASELLEARNKARAYVYDLRKYARENSWGPLIPKRSYRTGYINWKHVDAIITVIYNNLLGLNGLWPDTRPPAYLDAVRAYSAPNSHTRDPKDWAGVEGTWRRYVCFMDYRDLFTFNVGSLFQMVTSMSESASVLQFSQRAHESSFFEDDGFQEATRLIELNLSITRIGKAKTTRSASRASTVSPLSSPPPSSVDSSSSTSTPAPANKTKPKSQLPPPIHFVGKSSGGNGNESKVRGSVHMMPDGHIRWRFVSASIYDGHSQWSSEGIQLGGVCSAAGVVGTWTGARHAEGDPAGPFWLWKVEDNHPSHLHHN